MSDLFWIILSAAVAMLAAAWLWSYLDTRRRANERLAVLRKHGLSDQDVRVFKAVCRAGAPTPEYLMARIIDAATRARAAGDLP